MVSLLQARPVQQSITCTDEVAGTREVCHEIAHALFEDPQALGKLGVNRLLTLDEHAPLYFAKRPVNIAVPVELRQGNQRRTWKVRLDKDNK